MKASIPISVEHINQGSRQMWSTQELTDLAVATQTQCGGIPFHFRVYTLIFLWIWLPTTLANWQIAWDPLGETLETGKASTGRSAKH